MTAFAGAQSESEISAETSCTAFSGRAERLLHFRHRPALLGLGLLGKESRPPGHRAIQPLRHPPRDRLQTISWPHYVIRSDGQITGVRTGIRRAATENIQAKSFQDRDLCGSLHVHIVKMRYVRVRARLCKQSRASRNIFVSVAGGLCRRDALSVVELA